MIEGNKMYYLLLDTWTINANHRANFTHIGRNTVVRDSKIRNNRKD